MRTCAGVVSIISITSNPAPIPDHEIEDIRPLVESKLAYDPCPRMHEGMIDGGGMERAAQRRRGPSRAQRAATRGSYWRWR